MTASDVALIAELEALEREEKRRLRATEWCPHTPWPKQKAFLALNCLEALYGGAAAGGKSDALLMAALQHVDTPGYAALILRRTYADLALAGAIMSRSHEWLRGTRASWNDRDKRWTFPSGATLAFGYLDTEADRYRYQSAEFQYIGFDEATQFPEQWYRYLLSRLRRPAGSKIPIRARLASNPGGIGHAWVFKRFVETHAPERAYIPAKLADNPSVDADEYRKSLALLDTTTRRQLEEGIWVQDASGLVYRAPVTTPQPSRDGEWTYLLGIDFGVKDATAYVVLGWRTGERTVYVLESFKETNSDVTQAAEHVKTLQTRFPFSKIVGDLGGMGKAFGEEFTRRHQIPIEPAQKQNKRGYIGLLNGAIERRELLVVAPTNAALLKELSELPWKDESHLSESPGFDNHLTDALLYAWRATTAFSETPVPAPVTDPLEIIRQQTAEIWRQHEEERMRSIREDYDLGHRFDDA